jgi:uncharacterized membrane protein YgdD (TMEM256/DUF423 family)
MHKRFLFIASLFGAIAVSLGAFGAHGLKKIVSAEIVSTFQTGVQYQMYHVFALFVAGILYEKFAGMWLRWAGILFICGIILFSGSLYLLAFLKATERIVPDAVGLITPLGGLFFISGWIFLLTGIVKKS